MQLPVIEVLPQLLAVLRDGPNAVLVAPPGAGKTTAVAPALLEQDWCDGQIILLSPRRLAARAAAERMAEQAEEKPGGRIGYATRMDSRQSAATRILVVTEGIFVNRIQADPELAGVSAVLFDEVHERSLDCDFGLALALEGQSAFRPDLRLLAMSATLDGARFAALMNNAPVIESEGRAYPLEMRYIGRGNGAIEDDMAGAIRKALVNDSGDILAFLPGVREIERTFERLAGLTEAIAIHRLYGAIDPAAQRAAIRPDSSGRRKIILATSIAETSLTIDGVRIVIDSGMARRPRYDKQAGVTQLVTERASQAAVTQRAGRAARQGSGVAIRLWAEAATQGLPRFDPPEILESDLVPLVLQCAAWGEADPSRLRWIDPPPAPGIAAARVRLQQLDALDGQGNVTPHGSMLAHMPMPPHLAHMLVRAGESGQAMLAAEIAVLLQERGLGGPGEDLEQRRTRWRRDGSARADAGRKLAQRFAGFVKREPRRHPESSPRHPELVSGSISPSAPSGRGAKWMLKQVQHDGGGALPPAIMLALAFPDRVSKRRDSSGEQWQSIGGRGFRLDPASPLASSEWLAVAEVQGSAAGARILSAMALNEADIETHLGDRITAASTLSFNRERLAVEARHVRKLGAITLSSGPNAQPDTDAVLGVLRDAVRQYGLDLLQWGDAALALRNRAGFAGRQELSDATLLETLTDWFDPIAGGKLKLTDIGAGALHQALEGQLGWDGMQAVNRLAPSHFTSPAGTAHAIDYAAPAGPTVTMRVQALFGLAAHPCIGSNRVPLVLSLTSPAGRPIQTTRDLPAFWAGSWADVAKDMRGQYPRHNWPENPVAAVASLKTKRAQARDA